MNALKRFWREEDGMGVVEIILIIVVLIGLVVIFRNQIGSLVNSLLQSITKEAQAV